MNKALYSRLSTIAMILMLTNCQKDEPAIHNGNGPVIQLGTYLSNPSFEEGEAQNSMPPTGWTDCGPFTQSPPDVHSNDPSLNAFGVNTLAVNGTQYLGMVVRDNNTRECLTQYFDTPIPAGTYELNVVFARSEQYISSTSRTRQVTKFNQPVILKIYGISDNGEELLIYKTPPIRNTSWVLKTIPFALNQPLSGLKITPDYVPYLVFPPIFYNGNVLVDAIAIKKN